MSSFAFRTGPWHANLLPNALEQATLTSLCIDVGPERVPVTEVEDTVAQTIRDHINVPVYLVARWLLTNWWRLRWEPHQDSPTAEWLDSHCMSAIGSGYAWPALKIASDGEFVHLQIEPEEKPDVAAIRFLRPASVDIPVGHFERAVDDFLDVVQARVSLRMPEEHELAELRAELAEERRDPELYMECKLQALAGRDPGSACDEWLKAAKALIRSAGEGAAEEVVAATPRLKNGLEGAQEALSAMRASNISVDLAWAHCDPVRGRAGEAPWQRGARLAQALRARLGLPRGPIVNQTLEDLLCTKLPLKRSPWSGARALLGGYRASPNEGKTSLLVTKDREDSQRFYLARLIGAACGSTTAHVLAVSDAGTAFQKFERSFAQEFLCPWEDLDAYTNESDMDDDGIADAAEHFKVSELLVLSTLVNRGKLGRNRLQ